MSGSYNHAGVWDEGIIAATDFSDRFQKAGAKSVSKPEGVDRGWQLSHPPELGNIALRGTPSSSYRDNQYIYAKLPRFEKG